MDRIKYCRNCGQELTSEASFCKSCGARVDTGQQQTALQPPAQAYSGQPAAKRKGKRISIPAVIIGILLLLLGLRSPVLGIIGEQTSAVITDTEQIISSTSSRMDYNYRISYTFTDQNGKSYSSSYQMNKVYNISNLPAIHSTISVKYLPAFPQLNVPAGQSSGFGFLVLIALGLIITILGFCGVISLSAKKR